MLFVGDDRKTNKLGGNKHGLIYNGHHHILNSNSHGISFTRSVITPKFWLPLRCFMMLFNIVFFIRPVLFIVLRSLFFSFSKEYVLNLFTSSYHLLFEPIEQAYILIDIGFHTAHDYTLHYLHNASYTQALWNRLLLFHLRFWLLPSGLAKWCFLQKRLL